MLSKQILFLLLFTGLPLSVVFVTHNTGKKRTMHTICEVDNPDNIESIEPKQKNNVLSCSTGTRKLEF